MEANAKRLIEKYEADYHKIASKETWTKDDITMMKDLQKLMYYIEVRCAMKEGNDYPGSEHMPDAMSYARGRNSMGQYTSGGSGHYPMENGPWYYDQMNNGGSGSHYNNDYGVSGNRYYDGEKEAVIHKLHRMLDKEDNPMKRTAIQDVLREFEQK